MAFHQYDRRSGTAKLVLVQIDGCEAKTISADGEDVFPFRTRWNSESTLYYTADGAIKQADLVILDGDPANDIGETLSVNTTIKNGIIYKIDELLEPPPKQTENE